MRRIMMVGWLALVAQPAVAQVTYEGSFAGLTGYYLFTERTNSLIFTNGLRWRSGRLSLGANLPLWYQNTTLVSSSGGGTVPTGGPKGQEAVRDSGQARGQPGGGGGGEQPGRLDPPSSAQRSGAEPQFAQGSIPAPPEAIVGYQLMLGDPLAQATVSLIPRGRVAVSASAMVKVPLASTATIGTGKWDFGGTASASWLMGNRWTLGLDMAYWYLGDLDSLDLENPLIGTLSVGRLLGYDWAASLGVSASTGSLTGFDPPLSVMASLTRLGTPNAWGVNAGVGLTETAPAFSLGAVWWIRLTEPAHPR